MQARSSGPGPPGGAMTFEAFLASVNEPTPPSAPPALVALWHDARGDWEAAHQVAQNVDDEAGAWVHAYLHRKEGDRSNARYWYRRARQPEADDALDAEWRRIAAALCREHA
jgi:hypothetical protein